MTLNRFCKKSDAILAGTQKHVGIFRERGTGCNSVEQPFPYHDLLNTPGQCLPSRTSTCSSLGRRLGLSVSLGKKNFVEVVSATPWSTQDPRRALAHVSRHGSAFVLLCLSSMITAPRHAKHTMLETSFLLAPGSCPRVPPYIVRTAATLCTNSCRIS